MVGLSVQAAYVSAMYLMGVIFTPVHDIRIHSHYTNIKKLQVMIIGV